MERQFAEIPMLSLPKALSVAWSKLTKFSGRSRRSEYWWMALTVFVLSIILSIIPIIGAIIRLLLAFAMIPLTVRRLHDIGRSGWWYGIYLIYSVIALVITVMVMGVSVLSGDVKEVAASSLGFVFILLLIAVIYAIVLLVFYCLDSQKGPNKWGDSPKYVETNESADVQSEAAPLTE